MKTLNAKTVTFLILFLSTIFQSKAQWSNFGASMPSFVIGFENYNNSLLAYSYPSPYLYEWNGNDWQTYSSPVPLSGGIHRAKLIDTTLYVASYAASSTNRVYYKQGNTWQPLGGVFKNMGSSSLPSLYDIIEYNNEIYVAGEFNRVDSDTIYGVAKWNGVKWVAVGSGLKLGLAPYNSIIYPHNFTIYNSELILVGNFSKADNLVVNGIAAWNGTQWHGFGSGLNKAVYGATVYNNELYIGGEFTQSVTNTLGYVAKWNGSAWINPGFAFSQVNGGGANPFIHTLMEIGGKLYIAGGYNRVTDATKTYFSSGIMSFDGIAVDTLYGGVDSDAEAIFPYQNGLLVGGAFSNAGTTAVTNVAYLANAIGIKELNFNNNSFVYPNPCSKVLNLININNETSSVFIYNSLGKLIQAEKNKNQLDVSDLTPGVYLIRAFIGNKTFTTKFTKE